MRAPWQFSWQPLVALALACGDSSTTDESTTATTTSPATAPLTTSTTTAEPTTGDPATSTTSEPSDTTTAPTTAPAPACGDGVVDDGEDCDDANLENLDGCSNACASGYIPDPVTMGQDLPAVLPVLRVDVGGQPVMKDIDVIGTIQLFEDHAGTLEDLDVATPTLSTRVAFQGRGNFTWTLPKKGYAFELQDAAGMDLETPILGLPAGSDFALYACYTDKTCMRNALVFALGQEFGVWHPRARFVELILDGQYHGLYMLWERVRRDETRCDVDKPAKTMTDGDITGGYILRHEGGGKGQETIDGVPYDRDWAAASGRIYTYHYPDVDKLSPEQTTHIHDRIDAFESAIQTDPADHAAWIDVQSWVDHGILEELTNNWDGYVHSVYMVQASAADGGLLHMGPLWDFDLAFANGNVTGYNCATDNWSHQNVRPFPDDVPSYWLALYADPEFQRAFKCRWQSLRSGPISLATFQARVDAWKSFTAAARARDNARWNTIGMNIFPNCFSHPTYDEEVAALLAWIDARITWLDGQVGAMPGTCP